MIEVAHRQHGNTGFRLKASKIASTSLSNSDSSPLPLRLQKAPSSPLVNCLTISDTVEPNSSIASRRRSGTKYSPPRAKKGAILASTSAQSSPKRKIGPGAANTASSSRKESPKLNTTMVASANSSPRGAAVHRIRRGQKMEDFQPPALSQLPSIQTIDSAFQLQEYLSALLRQDVHDVDRVVAVPQPSQESLQGMFDSDKGKSKENENPFGGMEEEAPSVDTDVWIYEQLRRIVLDFSTPWLTLLQRECDKRNKSCEAMNADDWMYLCASHGEEKQCCAIDYMIHTLDGTTALLNSQRHFPSRTYIPTTSLRHFGSACRRISRIFVHTYEHHRDVFEACEAETALYARFLALVQTYDLIHVDSLPKLGKAAITVPKDTIEEQKVTKAETDLIDDEPSEHSRRGEKGLLFEADVAVPTDEDDEDEEDILEEEVEVVGVIEPDIEGAKSIDELDSKELSSLVESRPQRSDSVASRVTAIDISGSSSDHEVESTSEGKEAAEVEENVKVEQVDDKVSSISQDTKEEEEKPQSIE